MTFRPETSPKDSGNNKRYSTDGGNQKPQQHQSAAKISTIYDPRLLCTHHSAPAETTSIPVLDPRHQQSLYHSKKSLTEKIKKISHKLHTITLSSSSELDDAQKRMRLIKFVCFSILLACQIVVVLCIFLFMFSTGKFSSYERIKITLNAAGPVH